MRGDRSLRRMARFFVASPPESADVVAGRVVSPAPPAVGASARLDAEDSHHAARVLRLRVGEECEIVRADAPGWVWEARVETLGPPVEVRLNRLLEEPGTAVLYVALVQGLPVLSKVDEIIDKGTQVGVDEFHMVQAEQSPGEAGRKAAARVERWERLARAAAKQSRQPAVPSVTIEDGVAEAVSSLRSQGFVSVMLDPAAQQTLSLWLQDREKPVSSPERLAIYVGPEGGWTVAERECLQEHGVVAARLGRRILRTETAGIVAAAVVRSARGDW